ncbi:MAG: hypothetical protein JJU26_13270 [Oceanicaulis sp.]|uniref:hypothetical protein n=1 Tax=Glycocaulis sp. TaxID=1969725 RepID=UPI0025BC2A8F|nr:hypothetical protein [Glycocaulis sp.]MCC5982677.1 hypothetical protein [Oceanicaulis sp.]MCH8522391.1 hypothetical protein [Glycocaulis sp.]
MQSLNLPEDLVHDALERLRSTLEHTFEDMQEDCTQTEESRAEFEALMRRYWPYLGMSAPHPLWNDQSVPAFEQTPEDHEIQSQIDEADTSEGPARLWSARTYRRETIIAREDVLVSARSEREALEIIRDGEVQSATNFEISNTLESELTEISMLCEE